jgi:hypothetical protein
MPPVGASEAGTEHAHVSPFRSQANGVTRIPSTKIDQWALARIQRTVASAPIPFERWDGLNLPVDRRSPPGHPVVRFDRPSIF